jgi:hypothetical protein
MILFFEIYRMRKDEFPNEFRDEFDYAIKVFSNLIKGTTGFDSKVSELVSISRNEIILVKLISNF